MTDYNHANTRWADLERVRYGETTLTTEDATALREILSRAWWPCGACFGTGWKNYREYRTVEPLAPQIKCERCDGAGCLQGSAK